jgi:hypothetical protein
LAAGPVKWTERWIARAQRKADLRAERFVRHEAGVRAGTEPPGFLDRLESWIVFRTERFVSWGSLSAAYASERSISRNWPRAVRSDGAALAEEWRTWVAGGPVRGPDGVMVVIGVKYGGEDLPFDDLPDRAPVTRLEFAETRKVYSVCACQPSGRVWGFRFFATENQRTLVRGRARQDRAASRRHRTAAICRTPRAAPLGALGPRAGRADPRRPHQPARATAACPRTLAPDTNRRAMNIPASQSGSGVIAKRRCGGR